MTTKTRYPAELAREVAAELIGLLVSYCGRIEIAGSLRRGKPDVGDLELLYIPKAWETGPLFDASANQTDSRLASLRGDGILGLRRDARGRFTYGPLNKLLVHQETGLPVDLFTATSENWGRDLMVRTGSAEFNIRVMARFKAMGGKGHAYGPFAFTDAEGESHTAPDEATMFELLGLPFVPAGDRA